MENTTDNTTLISLTTFTTESPPSQGIDDDTQYQCDLANFVVRVGIMGPMIIFGFVGNTLAEVVMWPERNTSSTAFSLLMLAVVDNAYLVSRILLKTIGEISGFLGWWPEYKKYHTKGIIREVAFFLAQSTTMMTAWVTVVVAFQRYIAVCRPHRVNQLASLSVIRIQVALAILISSLFTLVMVVFEKDWFRDEDTGIWQSKTKDWAKQGTAYNLWYRTIIYWIIGYAVPLIMMLYFTFNLIRSLTVAKRRKENLTNRAKDKNGVTKTLIAVVIIFVLCQVVTPIRRMWQVFTDNRGCGTNYPKFNLAADIAGTFNSSVNFVLYCVFGLRFRRQLMKILPCFKTRIVPEDTLAASVTRENNELPTVPTNSAKLSQKHG